MTNERVIVIDPGERVGWATCQITPTGRIVKLYQGVTPLKEFALKFYRDVASGSGVDGPRGERPDTIVYETWKLRRDVALDMVGNEFQTSQLIGMIRMCAWLAPNFPALVRLEPKTKLTGRKVMPKSLRDRIPLSSEEHDKDALDLLSYYRWKFYGPGKK